MASRFFILFFFSLLWGGGCFGIKSGSSARLHYTVAWLCTAATHPGSEPLLLLVVAGQVPVQLLVDPAAAVLVRQEVRQRRRRPAWKHGGLEAGLSAAAAAAVTHQLTGPVLSPAGGDAKRDVGQLSALRALPLAWFGGVVLAHKHGPLGAVLTHLFGCDHARLDRVPVQSHNVGRRRCAQRRVGGVRVPTGQNCHKVTKKKMTFVPLIDVGQSIIQIFICIIIIGCSRKA